MGVKERVLELLEKHRGTAVSGEEIAGLLDISRASVWKAVKALRSLGYNIEGITNRGYCLLMDNNLLSKEGIRAHLADPERYQLVLYDTIDSTSTRAKQLAAEGCASNTVVIANHQTAGRGRLGRSFYSPAESGLYLSYVSRAKWQAGDAVLITTAVSVAVARAISALTGLEVQIKWVNDLYYQNKKICGILTEGIADFETGGLEAVVVGIGINMTTDVFPEAVGNTAGSLSLDTNRFTRNMLAAAVINALSHLDEMIRSRTFLEEYRERSMVIGRMVTIPQQNHRQVKVTGIDRNGGLVVLNECGDEEILRTGEISIRLTNDKESDTIK